MLSDHLTGFLEEFQGEVLFEIINKKNCNQNYKYQQQ